MVYTSLKHCTFLIDNGRTWLNKKFKIEEKSKLIEESDAKSLIGFAKEAMESMAMVDYPYEANFLSPLPGWPVKVSFKFLKSFSFRKLANSSIRKD